MKEIMAMTLSVFAFLFVLWIFYELYFYITHQHPLNKDEIFALAKKYRDIEISEYFKFDKREMVINPEFKSKLKSTGKMYGFNEKLYDTPSIIASILKGKKHEWAAVAFEKDKTVLYVWFNKGKDNRSVVTQLNNEEIKEFALENNITTVLHFHNHPNSNPNLYDCSNPSQTDLNSAEMLSNILNPSGINLIKFVCERGKYYKFYSSYSSAFMPVSIFKKDIEQINGKTKRDNYRLHMALRKLS